MKLYNIFKYIAYLADAGIGGVHLTRRAAGPVDAAGGAAAGLSGGRPGPG